MRIVGVSGSLRTGSSNTALVEAAVGLAPPGVGVDVLTGIADLPAFNPDHDTDPPPGPVAALRARLAAADAVIVSSPEYAHGVPGALKNALDWLVSSGELYGTPVGVVDTTAGGHAHRSLLETLRVMGAVPVEGAVVAVPRLRTRVDAGGRLDDAEAASIVAGALAALAAAATAGSAEAVVTGGTPGTAAAGGTAPAA